MMTVCYVILRVSEEFQRISKLNINYNKKKTLKTRESFFIINFSKKN